MKAAKITAYGKADVIEIKDVESPKLKDEQVLVEVKAASLNPIDYKVRLGYLAQMFPDPAVVVLGSDFSGIVKEVKGDLGLKVGDEVYGNGSILNGGSGAFAEYVVANASNTALKPKSLDFQEAAALPLAGASALQAIEEHIKVKPGQTILITGGSGGIGSFAIQIAKASGGYVAATASKKNLEFVKSLGADLSLDRDEDFAKEISEYDGVFDTTGNSEVINKSLEVLKKGGVIVGMSGGIDEEKAKALGVQAISQSTKTSSDKLKRIAELVDGGKIKVEVDKVFEFEEIKQAFEYLENGHPKGKVVIEIH